MDYNLTADTPLAQVDGFNYRALGRFRYAQINTLGELLDWSWEELADIRSMGQGTLDNIRSVLDGEGLELRP